MTKTEWLAMLNASLAQANDRKLRLFACAMARLAWNDLIDERSRHAVVIAERYADSGATAEELKNANEAASDAWACAGEQKYAVAAYDVWACTDVDSRRSVRIILEASPTPSREKMTEYVEVLHEIAGNPFCPIIVWPGPLSSANARKLAKPDSKAVHLHMGLFTADVLELAKEAYEKRSPDGCLDLNRLRVLSDALEDAGCVEESILHHLRSKGPHFRGCHVLDIFLRKER